jgi:hypothetical protein
MGFDGSAILHQCGAREDLGPADGANWIGAMLGTSERAFVNEATGECIRVPGDATFLHGRFQYLSPLEIGTGFSDRGPEGFPESLRLGAMAPPSELALRIASDDVLYLMVPPKLFRYDLLTRELTTVSVPAEPGAAHMRNAGDHIVGFSGSSPLWAFDVGTEELSLIDPEAPPGEVSARVGDEFILLSIDQRPTTWISLRTGEPRAFEVAIPRDAALEFVESGPSGLVVADGMPIAHFDVTAGTAREIALELAGGRAETLADGARAIVVVDGVPAFRVELSDGELREISGATVPLAGTERIGSHIVTFSAGVPRALLDREGRELLDVISTTVVPKADKTIYNDRYIVGLDARDWPVFRIDTSSRVVSAYAVSEPHDLVSLRDPRYVETPGDATYEQFYGADVSDPLVLDDGSVAVVLRDARQVRLWSVNPGDTSFQPLGRPFSDVIDLRWSATDHYFQIAADRGDCFCVRPELRWDPGADADVMPVGGVQVVSRAHPSLTIVRQDHLVFADPSGACVVEPGVRTLVHDLVAGHTLELQSARGMVRFAETREPSPLDP